jgi:hypothetical protein
MSKIVNFRRMEDGTREDYQLLETYEREYVASLPERILESAEKAGWFAGGISRDPAGAFSAGRDPGAARRGR